MSTKYNQRGFHIIELVLIVLILGIFSFIGYRLWTAYMVPEAASLPHVPTADIPNVPHITSPNDLDTAANALDQLDTSSTMQQVQAIEQSIDNL